MKSATAATLALLPVVVLLVVVRPLVNAFSLAPFLSRSTKHLYLAKNMLHELKITYSAANTKKRLLDVKSPADKSTTKLKASNDPSEKEPEYKPRVLARSFFGNPYFYSGITPEMRQLLANHYKGGRENSFGNETVKAILAPLKSRDEVDSAFEKSGVDRTKVVPFWKLALKNRTPEEVLNGNILTVRDDDEIVTIKKRYVELPILTVIKKTTTTNVRAGDIRFVLGPSGSGKTFCAVKIAAADGIGRAEKCVTVYFNMQDDTNEDLFNATFVVDAVKQVLHEECSREDAKYDQTRRLKLTLSVVLDEAGAAEREGRFESKIYVIKLRKEFRKLATKVRLVLCGTGLIANAFGSGTQALKYRMIPWTANDLVKVNNMHFMLRQEVLDAIQRHPHLKALTTNARAAWFLLDRAKLFLNADKNPDANDFEPNVVTQFQRKLQIYAPDIVRTVVTDYISTNGIQRLNDKERRRVAAAVFNIIESKELNVPKKFPGLAISNGGEQTVTSSLLSINVEIGSNGNANLVQGEERPFSISPALLLVLYWMCGIPIPMLSGWKRQELASALYECSRFMRACVSDYHNAIINLTEYNTQLFSLVMIELSRSVPEPTARKTFFIPYLTNGTIWMNRDLAPYADVVAPHALYQSKSVKSKSKPVSINLLDELGKCGLVKNSSLFPDKRRQKRNDIGWAITKSLDHIWQLKIDNNQLSSDLFNDIKTRFFYSSHQILWPSSAMDCRNATLFSYKSEWLLRLPNRKKKDPVSISSIQELSSDLTFYVSCNRNKITLKRMTGNGGSNATHYLTISEECIDDHGNVMEGSLSDQDLKEWQYYQTVLQDKVKLRFLLS